MPKSADAFRTISEVAEWLETPAHVLRFWESKFSQVRPVKRAGGRRYYRPSDMELLGGIKRLLHEEGMTIKGVQKLLRDRGTQHVAAMSPPLEDLAVPLEAEIVTLKPRKTAPPAEAAPETGSEAPAAPAEGPGPMTAPDGSEAGAQVAGAGDGAVVAGHGTDEAPAELPDPAPATEAEPPVTTTAEKTPEEELNLFSDLAAAAEDAAAPETAEPVIPDDPEDDDLAPAPGILARLAARTTPLPGPVAAEALALARRLPALD